MTIAANVIKRDGRVEPFIPEKVAISCVRAGLKPDIAHKIATEISKHVYPNMPTTEIRKDVAKLIAKYNKAVARAYLSYGMRTWSRPPREPDIHRHRPRRRRQAAFGGKVITKPSRLGKKKVGVGRPPR